MRTIGYLLAASAMVLSGAVTAQSEGAPDYSAMSDSEFRSLVRDNSSRFVEESCEVGVPIASELYRRSPSDQLAGTLLFLRSYCAHDRGEYRAAADLMQERERRFGLTAPDDYWFYLSLQADDSDMALTLLDRLLEADDPATLAEIRPDRFFGVSRLLVRAGRDAELGDIALRFFETGKSRHFDEVIQQSLAVRALRAAARQGNRAFVPDLLGIVRDPSIYVEMLTLRAYEPIWPGIEERAGANLTTVAEENAAWALTRSRDMPSDRDRFSDAAHALHYAGRFEEAVELARGWREAQGAFDRIEEGDAWALNIEAYALDSLGRRTEADAAFDRLAAFPGDDYPWVVNFAINRATRLVGQKRYDEALEAAQLARAAAEKHGTTYAKAIIAHDFVCALEGLGRSDEIEPELAYLLENRSESVELVAEALMCLGRDDQAAELVLEALADETLRERALNALQRPRLDLFYTASELPQASDLRESRPDVRREFERWAREMPEEFIPRAALRREELKR